MSSIINEIESLGIKAKLITTDVLKIIQSDLQLRKVNGEISDVIYKQYLESFDFSLPEILSGAKSILIIAIPRPQIRTEFLFDEKAHVLLIPPTYTGYNSIPKKIREKLEEIFCESGIQFIKTKLPEKSLAVRSGLAFYGRNNISFIPVYGSFFQLASFFTSIEDDVDNPQEPRMLERCNHCTACINVCPTNAITKERFVIEANKCLTYFNENEEDFPEWIKEDSHNSLVGCILCQKFCPENKKVKNWFEENISFDETETEQILNSENLSELSETTQSKIQSLDLINTHISYSSFKRNLNTLLQQRNHETN